jgi:hypothetical protein
MKLLLTAEQQAAIEPHLRDGTNSSTSGRLRIELGAVPSSSLPALRAAITQATAPKAPAPKKPKRKSEQ